MLLPDSILHAGEVLVDSKGIIQCAACDCSSAPNASSASVVTCANGVISPGLINPHDHITYANNGPGGTNPPPATERWEHRNDWRIGENGHDKITTNSGASQKVVEYAELRFVMSGVTSGATSGGEAGLMRNLDKAALLGGLPLQPVDFDTFPLGDSNGTELTSGCGYPTPNTKANVQKDTAYLPHVSEGIGLAAENEFVCEDTPGVDDIILSQDALIHAVGLDAKDAAAAKSAGVKIIWSPRSNLSLYGNTAMVTMLDMSGLPIALGTDWIPSGSMNILRELACADSFNTTYLNKYFSDADLWRMVTLNAAFAVAGSDVLGVLGPGHVADIAIFDGTTDKDYRAILNGKPETVVLVLRGGKVLYGDDGIVSDPDIGGQNCETLDVCGVSKRACVAQDLNNGDTLASIQAAGSAYYPLFFCGQDPTNEPSCVPFRGDAKYGATYTGMVTASDSDGDGIDDAMDDCPHVFNPIRPMDGNAQADADGDGEGDACDPCPLDPTDKCVRLSGRDVDGDGVPNGADNCPFKANPDQKDSDGDGKGDACDFCPMKANPGEEACN